MVTWMSSKKRSNRSPRGHFLKRVYTRLASYNPPRSIIAVVIVGASIFLIGGGIYDLFMNPVFMLPFGVNRRMFGISTQTVVESIGVMMLYTLGFIGLILIYYSARYLHNERHAFILLSVGVTMLLASIIVVEQFILQILYG